MKLPEPRRNPNSTDPAKAWVVRHEAPAATGGKRRQPRVYGRTRKECTDALLVALGQVQAGMHVDGRRAKYAEHLDRRLRWWESERELKPKTLSSYREAADLYLRPALGHIRLADLRGDHFRDLAAAMRLINRPEADDDQTDLLRRLLGARATRDGKRVSGRPLSDARIKRVMAVASSSLADLVPHVLPVNPAAAVKTGKGKGSGRKVKPLLWTAPRVDRWRETGQIPGRVMVWTREHCGAFLDGTEDERLYSLYHLAAYYGLRRSELCGLAWSETDLATRRVHVRQAQVDDELDSTKSEDSDRDRGDRRGHRGRAAGVAQGAAGRADGVGRRVDGHGPRVHPRGRDRAAPGMGERAVQDSRGAGRTAADQAPRPPARRGDDAARRGHPAQGHQRGPRPLNGRVHDGRVRRGRRGARRRGSQRDRRVHPARRACRECAIWRRQ